MPSASAAPASPAFTATRPVIKRDDDGAREPRSARPGRGDAIEDVQHEEADADRRDGRKALRARPPTHGHAADSNADERPERRLGRDEAVPPARRRRRRKARRQHRPPTAAAGPPAARSGVVRARPEAHARRQRDDERPESRRQQRARDGQQRLPDDGFGRLQLHRKRRPHDGDARGGAASTTAKTRASARVVAVAAHPAPHGRHRAPRAPRARTSRPTAIFAICTRPERSRSARSHDSGTCTKRPAPMISSPATVTAMRASPSLPTSTRGSENTNDQSVRAGRSLSSAATSFNAAGSAPKCVARRDAPRARGRPPSRGARPAAPRAARAAPGAPAPLGSIVTRHSSARAATSPSNIA